MRRARNKPRDHVAETIDRLTSMSVHEADHALCDMPKQQLLDIGDALGLSLPWLGGDKPARIGVALQQRRQTRQAKPGAPANP